MSNFGDIRSAVHGGDKETLLIALRDYEGNLGEAEAIARYVVDGCEDFHKHMLVLRKDGCIDMVVGRYRPTVMRLSNHAIQSVALPYRKRAQHFVRYYTYDPDPVAAIESWLKHPNVKEWIQIKEYMEAKKREVRGIIKRHGSSELFAHRVVLFSGTNLHDFVGQYCGIHPLNPPVKSTIMADMYKFLLKEYKCPTSET